MLWWTRMRESGNWVPVGEVGRSQNERKWDETFRNPKDVRDSRLEAIIEGFIVLVHEHPRILLELKRVREKHWLGYHW